MRSLLPLLRDHEGPLTADFQRLYTLRLSEAVHSRSASELMDLIVWLPPESAFRASFQHGDEALKHWSWSQDRELMIGVMNLIAHQTYVIAQSNSQKRIPPPKPIESPISSSSGKRTGDATAIARALLAAQKG